MSYDNDLFSMMRSIDEALETLYRACNLEDCPTCPMNPKVHGFEAGPSPKRNGKYCPVKILERYFPGGEGNLCCELPNGLKNCVLCDWFRDESVEKHVPIYKCGHPKHPHELKEVTTARAWCMDYERKPKR